VLAECEAIFHRAAMPLGVLDPSSNRLVAANDGFAALLRVHPSEVPELDILALVTEPDRATAETLLGLVKAGVIEACQLRGRVRAGSSEIVEVLAWVRLIDPARPDAGVIVGAVPAGMSAPWTGQPLVRPHFARAILATLDHEWRFSAISPDATELLGWDRQAQVGKPFQALVHPQDAPMMLLALGRSSADGRGVATALRISGHDGDWMMVRCEVTPLCEHNPPRFALAVWNVPSTDEAGDVERAARLEGHLWRIAMEVRMAGVAPTGPAEGQAWWGHPDLDGLTPRQFEVLTRLVAGERTPAIADALFLSPSTVRNHLSAIYRRLGVRSQQELFRRLRSDAPVNSAGEAIDLRAPADNIEQIVNRT
jgi:DNA-binding CsgD family transcriptional regulator/PAS domain-containing protein